MPGSILRPNGSTPGFGFILTGTKRAAATGGHNIIPTPLPPPLSPLHVVSGVGYAAEQGAQDGSVSMNAYQRSSAEIWMHFSARICRGRGNDEGSSFSDWEDASSNTGHRYSSYSSSRFTSLGEADTSTGRAPLQHGGIPPRSQIHDGANLKKSQEQAWTPTSEAQQRFGCSFSKHERLPAKLSRDLDAASARICRGRGNDEGFSFSDWVEHHCSMVAYLQRSQIHDGANWKKSQEHRFSQGTRVVVSRCNSHSRVISQHQNADRQQLPRTTGFGVGKTAGSQQWQGGPIYFWRNDGWWYKDSEADELGDTSLQRRMKPR